MEQQTIKPFCMVPWNHAHLKSTGVFTGCCRMINPGLNSNATNFDEHWNSPEIRKLRVQMMNNEPPSDICANCLNNRSTIKPACVTHNNRAKNYIEDILAQTDAEGFTTWLPRTMDIRTATCNLKCRICYPGASSAIKNEFDAAGWNTNLKLGPLYLKEESIGLPEEMLKNLEFIGWAGGEPFMSKLFFNTMARLRQLGNTNLNIWCNSNFTFPGKTLQKTADAFYDFTDVRIGISMDAAGVDYDYIRDGASYTEVIANIKEFQALVPQARLFIDFTATSMGLLTLPELMRKSVELGVSMVCKVAILDPDRWLNINNLRPEIFEKACEDILLESYNVPFTKGAVDFKEFVAYMKTQYTPIKPDNHISKKHEDLRGRSGYFLTRMNGFLVED